MPRKDCLKVISSLREDHMLTNTYRLFLTLFDLEIEDGKNALVSSNDDEIRGHVKFLEKLKRDLKAIPVTPGKDGGY